MNKIRVLQFPIASSRGGITQYVLNNWKFINKEQFHFDFATMSKTLPMKDELESQGSRVYFISCYAEENMEQFKKEFKDILSNGYDIVHLHTKQWKSFCVEQVAKECGVKKVIIHAHSTGIDTQDSEKHKEETLQHYQLRDKVSAELGTDFLACSWMAAEFLYGDNISKKDIRIMQNAIDVSKFVYNPEVREKMRKELSLENSFVIGHVGRFTYAKNHEFLIEVFRELQVKCPGARLLLVGTGELEDDIKMRVKEFNLVDKVIFLGHCTETNLLFQAMDVFVLPSRFEGVAVASVEAQAAGLKCIVSEMISEEVKVSHNVVQLPFDAGVWAEQILQYRDGYERENTYKDITKRGYNIKNEILNLEKIYKQTSEKAKESRIKDIRGGGILR